MTTELMIGTPEEREQTAALAAADPKTLDALLEALSGSSRSKRQRAAATIALVAVREPQQVIPKAGAVVDALNRPEAQTRWECLNALCTLVAAGYRLDAEALAATEEALFDEESGIVREAAFRLLCTYGATSAEASEAVWPNVDEAIQCYHGNGEFSDMLTALVEFAEGAVSDDVLGALAERMRFDATNARGTLRMRSEQIVAASERRGGGARAK